MKKSASKKSKSYFIDICEPDPRQDSHRFLLGVKGKRPLVVIGLNPSTTDKEQSDRTITRVRKYTEKKYEGLSGDI